MVAEEVGGMFAAGPLSTAFRVKAAILTSFSAVYSQSECQVVMMDSLAMEYRYLFSPLRAKSPQK